MPLKLLKRTSKQYNVVSKSTFVLSVTLLDNGIMECTLDADSTGNHCLQNISQRLGLHQPEFFGLRYISRGVPPRQRWIELEQPLKKQLDKYAEDSQLSLGVMFYVSDVNLLRDEMARYHYFLQLKSDVIESKLNCSIDQAISLAAYSLQAEFGDYDPERHTVDYLRDFAILPKDLTSEESPEINLDALFDSVARQYGSLVGFPPPLAEIYYIMVAQQLDGYGQECYPAKDDSGNDILICVSLNGLVIRRRDWTHIAAFRWSNIKSLMGHKRTFVLESAQSQRTMQFHFSDPEVVKYVRKICILQSTFQKENLKLEQCNGESQKQNSSVNYSAHASSVTDSFDCASHSSSNANLRVTPDSTVPYSARIGSQHSLNNNFNLAQNAAKSKSSTGFNLQFFNNSSLPSPQYRHQMLQQQPLTHHHFHRSLQELSGPDPQYGRPLTPMMPDLGAGVPMNHSLSLNPNGTQNCDVQALLPSYRPAPDYDTAVQLKYGCHPQQQHSPSIIGTSNGETRNLVQLYYDTQNEEEEPIYQNEIVSKIHSIELRDSREAQQKRTPTPEVTGQKCQQEPGASADVSHLSYMYKPPPPYPGASGSITSPSTSVTKPRSSFNTHAEVLKQISSDLNNRSTELPNSLGHNPLVSSSGTSKSNVCLKDNFGSTSIIKELTKSMGAQVTTTRGIDPAENEAWRTDATQNAYSTEELALQGDSLGSTELPFFRRPIDSNIMKEFLGIQKAKVNPNFTTGMKRENAKRNRTPCVLPYEDNSIRLSPSRQNPDGYINASPISVELGDRAWKYSVGQIPLSGNGPTALWQMIWETESKIVVSLERDSSAPFYPSENCPTITFGDFQLTDSKSQRSTAKASIASELILTFLPKKKQRRVWVLPYDEEWKDDVPIDTEHFLCFLEEVNSVQRKVSEDLSPLTVLCGTGAGRSGVFVLSDLLLHAADAGHKIHCDNILSELRTKRMLLVTHPQQYTFVLDTLAKYLAQSRLI